MGDGSGSGRLRETAIARDEWVWRAGEWVWRAGAAARARLTVAAFFAGTAETFLRFGRLALRALARGFTEPFRGAGFFARPVFNESPRLAHSFGVAVA